MKEKIEKIANVAFERLLKVYESKTEGGIIFPKYTHGQNKGKLRVSEQEMRFAFVEEMCKKHPDWYYSVETPTEKNTFSKESLALFQRRNRVVNRHNLTSQSMPIAKARKCWLISSLRLTTLIYTK